MAAPTLTQRAINFLNGILPGSPFVPRDLAEAINLGDRLVEMQALDATNTAAAATAQTTANTGVTNAATANTALGKLVSGTATILSGTASITVTGLSAYNGKPVFAMFQAVDGVKVIVAAVIAGGTLTITASANTTADRLVAYWIDGR